MNEEIQKINPITKEFYQQTYEIKQQGSSMEAVIEHRMNYVIRKSLELLGFKVEWWCIQSREGRYDTSWDVFNIIHRDAFYPEDWSIKGSPEDEDVCFTDKFGEHWYLFEGFPSRWLFEDFEEELIEGRKIYVKQMLKEKTEQKNKEAEEKRKKKVIAEKALKKLSDKEKEALGLKRKNK